MTDSTPSAKVYEAFRTLLQNSLWDRSEAVNLDSRQWQELFDLAKRQAVATLLFDALKRLPCGPDTTLAAKWLMYTDDNERLYRKTKSAIAAMSEIWSKLGVEACVLKGLEVAKLYPVPEHRSCGDVDWYFSTGEHREKADRWVVANAAQAAYDSDSCLHYSFFGVLMEHHNLGIDPTDTNAVLRMYSEHILKHAMVMGIGFRQFCDLSLAYSRFKPEHCEEPRWRALLDAFLVRETGLDATCLPSERWRTIPAEDIDTLLSLVLKDGNFGLQKSRRLSGLGHRAGLFLRYAPGSFCGRWISLLYGRTRNIFRH